MLRNIFITGGAGYIGSHCVVSLVKNNFNPIILDNFSNSHQGIIKKLEKITNKKITFFNVDIRNKKKLRSIFKKNTCYAVIHCAGYKAVAESVQNPVKYFDNNIDYKYIQSLFYSCLSGDLEKIKFILKFIKNKDYILEDIKLKEKLPIK